MSVPLYKLFQNLALKKMVQIRQFSPLPQMKPQKGHLLISYKRKELNHYNNVVYDVLDEVPLASKGWNHSKSKGDFFTINPLPEVNVEAMTTFKEIGIVDELISVLKEEEIKKATNFQAKVIPKVLSDQHLMIAAETGCGKTISYLLPIIQNLMGRKCDEMNCPQALVLVPNRELAYQVGEVAQMLGEKVGLNVKITTGGRTKQIMMNPDFSSIDILVGTPGAIGKLSTVGVYKLDRVVHTVLDEADTLVDDSFIDRIGGILKRVSQSQIILVSATVPKNMPDILKPIEENMTKIISPKVHKPLLNVNQKFLRLTRSNKPCFLLDLAKTNKSPMLVFTNRNETCNWLAMFLRENNITCANINGDMNYAIRIQQWNDFISGNANILSATDVGSRGLDTTQVRHVVNYDFPLYAADYLHRIGRVGRLGSHVDCKITNFVAGPQEVKLVQQIEYAIKRNQPLLNVDGNITNIVQRKIEKSMKQNV